MDWPTSLIPQACTIGLRKMGVQFRSPFNGTVQSVRFFGERWILSLTLPPRSMRSSGAAEALLAYLAGGVNQINCWHFARPVPRGTMRGSPEMAVSAAAGDTHLHITGGTANSTLLAGDMLKAGGQLHQVLSDVQLDGYGEGTVQLVNYVRSAIDLDDPVTWDYPKVPFICTSFLNQVTFHPRMQDAPGIDLEEVW